MANSPDHWNAYVTLGASALSIVGTLGGLWLGSYIQQKRDANQREYTDRTRFHDVRLEAYCKFSAATMELAGGAKTWADDDDPDTIGTCLESHGLLSPFHASLSTAQIVASPAVKQTVEAVSYYSVGVLDVTTRTEMEAALMQLLLAVNVFEAAARKELGIK